MSDEHLYPARAGMLRRGTPVAYYGDLVVVAYVGQDRIIVAWDDNPPTDYLNPQDILDGVRLDLRDVTARAHAAMAYTKIGLAGTVEPGDSIRSEEVGAVWEYRARGPILDAPRILARMRMLDEAVTVAEARAALDWAHAASGGQP